MRQNDIPDRRRLAPALLVLALCAPAARAQPQPAPDPSPAAAEKTTITAHAMVSAANPLAVRAGVKVLKAGGSAIDAAVAVQAVLGLVEPQSSGVGGGAFLLYYDARTGRTTAYDGREIAPAGADAAMFLGADGKPLPFFQGVLSGRSTGVPGAIGALALAQTAHGRLAWKDLFGDAIRMAQDGFPVPHRLAADILETRIPQPQTADARRYLTRPDGTAYRYGDLLKNPAYAATLKRLARDGSGALYSGALAADISAKTHEAPLPGTLVPADFATYRPARGGRPVPPLPPVPYLRAAAPVGRGGRAGADGRAGAHRHRRPRPPRPPGLV